MSAKIAYEMSLAIAEQCSALRCFGLWRRFPKGFKKEKSPDTTPGSFYTLSKMFCRVTTPNEEKDIGTGLFRMSPVLGTRRAGCNMRILKFSEVIAWFSRKPDDGGQEVNEASQNPATTRHGRSMVSCKCAYEKTGQKYGKGGELEPKGFLGFVPVNDQEK